MSQRGAGRGRRPFLAWLQLAADKRRLCAAVAGIGFAVVLMLMQLGFRDALYNAAVLVHSNLNAELVMVGTQYEFLTSTKPFTRRELYRTLSDEDVDSVVPMYVGLASWRNPETHRQLPIFVMGFASTRQVLRLPGVRESFASIRMQDRVLFDEGAMPGFGPIAARFRSGQEVFGELGGRRVKVSGLFKLGSTFTADGNVIANEDTFLRIFPERREGAIDIGLLKLKPGADPHAARARLSPTLSSAVRLLTREEFEELEKNYWAKNSPIGFIFSMGVFVGFLVGAVIVYQILYTDVMNHLGEYATLKAMGYQDGYLFGVVLQQSLILSLLGFVPGCAVSHGFYVITRNATMLPAYMTPARALLVLALTVGMCTVSGALAMRKLKAADPAEIF